MTTTSETAANVQDSRPARPAAFLRTTFIKLGVLPFFLVAALLYVLGPPVRAS